jgi:cytochrome c peroxidase
MKTASPCRGSARCAAAFAAAALLVVACGPGTPPAPSFTDADLGALRIQPTPPPSTNKVTLAKVELGKLLYHDKSLSKDGTVSCASCHDLDKAGVDRKPVSEGVAGQKGGRNAPTSLNAALHFVQFWDGRATTIEDQAIGPVLNPIEHGVENEAALVAKLAANAETVVGFRKAFPGEADPVSPANFQAAVGAFERTLITRSRFDDFLDGKSDALTAAEQVGLRKFLDTGCQTCHMSRLLGGTMFQKLGLVQPFPTKDVGRAEHTKQDADKFFFKVPSLLNIADTAPYYHDGSIATLEESIDKMAWSQRGIRLTQADIASIATFLKALSGKVDPRFLPKE